MSYGENSEGAVHVPEFRPELAFPRLTEEMIARLRSYGQQECLPTDSPLFTFGERDADMFVVLDGEIGVSLPVQSGERKVIAHHRRFEFSGELNLLNSQGSLTEARTVTESSLLRVPRDEFKRMMRAEGDIANLVTQATIWRRIGMLADARGGVALIGQADDAEMAGLQQFLLRNSYPYRIVDPNTDEAAILTGSPETESLLPAAALPSGRILNRPAITELADELGITELPDPGSLYDVVVVGGGPAGLAAAVYAASEGLCTVVVEAVAPGGQAGTSSRIENYLGFPTGISGQRLASRAQLQALKFGVHFSISREVIAAELIGAIHRLTLAGGVQLHSRAVVIASGALYRKLSAENYSVFENHGIYYAATAMEASLCRNKEVVVVGGGNSAGQAAVFLAGTARHVHQVVRGSSLASTMSQYLIARIESSARITLYTDSEITKLEGGPSLETVTWIDRKSGELSVRAIGTVFVMIGAEPNAGWLYGTAKLDNKGFVCTGGADGFQPTPYATNVPGCSLWVMCGLVR